MRATPRRKDMPENEARDDGAAHTRRIALLLHVGFALIGVVNTMLGAILPLLSARWRLDDAGAGALFLIQSGGAMTGSALSGLFIKRYGYPRLIVAGFCLMAAGTATLGFGPWSTGVVSIAVMGLSLGLTIPTINLLVAELNVARRAAALNILNLLWGVGAVSGPLIIPFLARVAGFGFALSCAGIAVALIAAPLARGQLETASTKTEGENATPRVSAARLWLSPYALLTAALVFVNVGTESATGGWVASYVQRLDPASQLSWVAAPSLFWAGLLAGRAFAPLIFRRLSEKLTMLCGMFVAVAGLLIILYAEQTAAILAGVTLTGLGLAPVFPTTIALFTERFGADAPRLTGALFVLAGLGAAVFPWLVGLASSNYGALRAGLVVPLIGGVAMIVLHAAIIATSAGRK